jgi:hypothetical protein
MPSALEYIRPTDMNKRKVFESELRDEKRVQRARYRTALRYYMGNQDKAILYEDDESPDDNTTINMVKLTIDRTKAFLFPAMPEFELDPEQVEKTDEEVWINEFFEANGGLERLHKMALRGCLSGHIYVRMKPVPEDLNGDTNFFPQMIILDPTSVSAYWRADDKADIIWYEYRYMVGDTLYIEDIVKEDFGRSWSVYTYESKQKATMQQGTPTHHGKATLSIDNPDWSDNTTYTQVSKQPHTWIIPPIIEWGHMPHPDDYYGLSEFTQKDLQDSINRVASERARIVRENSDPVDIVTGHDGDEIEKNGGLVVIPSPQARFQRAEMKGDLAGSTETLRQLIETYLAVAMTVLLKGEAKDLQRVTNASVRTLFLDMLSKNTLLQATYGAGLKKIVTLALMMGVAAGTVKKGAGELEKQLKKLKVSFGSALPIDLMEVATINQTMVGLGARSLQTAASVMGDDWAQEQAQMAAELDAQVERQQKMMEAFPDQTVGPDGKPTGAPSPDKQHEQALEMEKTKAKKPLDKKTK